MIYINCKEVTTFVIPSYHDNSLLASTYEPAENYCFRNKTSIFFLKTLMSLSSRCFHVSFEMLENIVCFSPREEKKHSGKRERREKEKEIDFNIGWQRCFCFFLHDTKWERSQRVTVFSRRELNMKLTITQVLDRHHSITPDGSLKKYYYSYFTHKENWGLESTFPRTFLAPATKGRS